MFIKLQNKCIIGNIYRRPSELIDDLNMFINEFTETLHSAHLISKKTYVTGDFNIDLLKINNHNYYNAFYENITAQGFFPKITRPTRLSTESSSLIDNILTNNLGKRHISGIITTPISDHLMNFCILEGINPNQKSNNNYVEIEKINKRSLTDFKNSISKIDLISKIDNNIDADPSENYDIIAKYLAACKSKHIPKQIKKFNKRKHKKEKWMTDDILTLVNKKSDMYNDWKSTNNNDEFMRKKINFKTFEKIVDLEIESAKSKYYHDTFMAQKNDMRKTWSTINDTLNRNANKSELPNEFIIDNVKITNSQDIASKFNDFFASIGQNLSSKININDNSLQFTDYLNRPTEKRFSFQPITEKEIMSIIGNLKNKNSSGKDEISNKLLKSIKHEISKPLSVIINQSLVTGIYPDALKIAKVKPLYKKGDKTSLNNYRPISLLPTISKIFERVLFTQIYNYFNTNQLLSEQQYGFRSKHSTELATIKLVDYIIKELDDRKKIKTPVAIFLDLSKAFDTLDFNILLSKLQYYGICDTPLSLMKSYLTNRYQYVQYKNWDSELLELKTGIPQGSILGPLIFSIYINDLVYSSNKLSFLLYADDTTLYFNLEDFAYQDREFHINNELEKVNIWLKLNKLTLNTDKTKCMYFHKRRTINPIQLYINNINIDITSHFSFLGIILDENLSWKNHINMITIKLAKITGILSRLKYVFPHSILLTIYKSLFVPHINYGSLVWGTNYKDIAKIQKKAIRTITHSNYTAHTEPLLKHLQLLNVKDMFSLKVLKFLHRLSHSELPSYFDLYRPYLRKIATPYSLRQHPLPLPPITHVYAESALIFQLVQMKNNISIHDRLILQKLDDKSHSFSGFGNYVRNNMLDKYSYDCTYVHCHTCGRL